MDKDLSTFKLWLRTLAPGTTPFEGEKEMLRQAFDSFRERIKQLVSTLSAELPMLTVHDITHLDALWRVADEIAGPEYPINPAEAFVLGGAFLLHDAAHVLAAYPGGLFEVKGTLLWQDIVAKELSGAAPIAGSSEEKELVFRVLRHLHASQARDLAKRRWTVPASRDEVYLLEHPELRNHYADLIGEIASSHHWPASEVAIKFGDRNLGPPSFLPTPWTVDPLKIALLLRTADVAHLDDGRAPWFLFALHQPRGVSLEHWKFQSKMAQPVRTFDGRLQLSAGSPFTLEERRAWWLAFDTALLVDRELRDACGVLRDYGRQQFSVSSVANVSSPEEFAKHVPVRGWEPVDVAPKIDDVPRLISVLGGSALYGEDPSVALRELLQNALDSVRAVRALGVLDANEGSVVVDISPAADGWWLSVLDTGAGMSRHVLTTTLLDFGGSLWHSSTLYEELPGLSKTGFQSVGKFGIGFYSVFMLGMQVRVTTRRFERVANESSDQWLLRFDDGLEGRPLLLKPLGDERLQRHGTRVSVKLSQEKLEELTRVGEKSYGFVIPALASTRAKKGESEEFVTRAASALKTLIAWLCPSSNVTLKLSISGGQTKAVVTAYDWKTLSAATLCGRVKCEPKELYPIEDEGGSLVGRLCLEASGYTSQRASVTFKGVRSGELPGLAGLVEGHANNTDARRARATLALPITSWVKWAGGVLAGTPESSQDFHLRLHPLLPQQDFPIWGLGKCRHTLDSLVNELVGKSSVGVYVGDIDYEDHDDVGKDNFSYGFEIEPELVTVPSFTPYPYGTPLFDNDEADFHYNSFPWVLRVEPLNYVSLFEERLSAKWGDLEVEEIDEYCVGYVNGVEIQRSGFLYVRK